MIEAHHDGSELYVSNSAPKIGDKVTLRVRVPKKDGLNQVYLRIMYDAEPRILPLKRGKSTSVETWWSIQVKILNHSTSYRFLFLDKVSFRWLNGAGVFNYDVVDREDFRIIARPQYPEWIKQSVFYQIFPDRFATSGQKRELPDWAVPREWNQLPNGRSNVTGQEFYGGDFQGATAHLDHLTSLGVNAIYFTPFFPSRSNHRYDASSFDFVDPLLGGDKGLIEFSKAAQQRGLKVMGDLTTNHCGAGHPWLQKSLKKSRARECEFFYWDDASPYEYIGWYNTQSLPKLNYNSQKLHELMYSGADSIVKKWLRPPFNMAGWRIDVANMTGRYLSDDFNKEVARGIRDAMDKENPEAWLVAENADFSAEDLDGFGWHGTMNYNGFTMPLWQWIHDKDAKLQDHGRMPGKLPKIPGTSMVAAMRQFAAGIPWRSLVASMTLLDSHDRARFHSVVGKNHARHIAGLCMLMTYPGVPSVFAGDEVGLEGAWGEDARRTINWDSPEKWDHTLFGAYQKLIAIHRSAHALQEGGLRWITVKDDVVAYLRESKKESILVVVSRKGGRFSIDLAPYGYTIKKTLYGPTQSGKSIQISSRSAVSGIWKLA